MKLYPIEAMDVYLEFDTNCLLISTPNWYFRIKLEHIDIPGTTLMELMQSSSHKLKPHAYKMYEEHVKKQNEKHLDRRS